MAHCSPTKWAVSLYPMHARGVMIATCHYRDDHHAGQADEAQELERVMETGWRQRAVRTVWKGAGQAVQGQAFRACRHVPCQKRDGPAAVARPP